MKAEIHDLNQFFKFCQLHTCLITIAEQNHQILYKCISKILKDSKKAVINSLKLDSPLKTFCELNKFSIVDLDLLQISVSEQTRSISIELYLEKSIFEPYNKARSYQVIKKLEKSQLIKNNYLVLENPFNENQSETPNPKGDNKSRSKSIIDILNTGMSKNRNKKKIKIEFNSKPYLKFDQLLEDIFLLDKILNSPIENNRGISKENLDLLYSTHLNRIKESYCYTLKNVNRHFSKFLSKYDITLKELFLIIKYLTQSYELNHTSFQFSEKLYTQFKDKSSKDKLVKNKLLKKIRDWFELTPKAIKGLLNIESEEQEEDSLVIIESPIQTFDKVCLSEDIKKQLLNSINQFKNKDLIFNQWGLSESIKYGKGVTLNLSGPPGTGKTLSVRAIANYLGKKLLTINLSQIESLWVGETEKNLHEAFKEAKKKDALLFLDEADSLTTRRENARTSWEITRTNTLLKELENFEGICIFSTNFAENYDEAFNRRLSAHIEFKMPDKDQLKTILEIHFPKKEALADDVNFLEIAKKYVGVFTGGDVKNIALNAARIAAGDVMNKTLKICHHHIVDACSVVFNSKKHSFNSSNENQMTYIG